MKCSSVEHIAFASTIGNMLFYQIFLWNKHNILCIMEIPFDRNVASNYCGVGNYARFFTMFILQRDMLFTTSIPNVVFWKFLFISKKLSIYPNQYSVNKYQQQILIVYHAVRISTSLSYFFLNFLLFVFLGYHISSVPDRILNLPFTLKFTAMRFDEILICQSLF